MHHAAKYRVVAVRANGTRDVLADHLYSRVAFGLKELLDLDMPDGERLVVQIESLRTAVDELD
ncbi:MAG: hypothetical protein ACM3U2_01690 [Deltaproteobacteria bacterium]